MFKVNIIIPFRPNAERATIKTVKKEDTLSRALFFLNKNSFFKHKIIIATDSDVDIENIKIDEDINTRIMKSNYVCQEKKYQSYYRMNAAYLTAINSILDNEWVCFGYTSDLICSNCWDLRIFNAIQKFGDNYVYVPMFVEEFPKYPYGEQIVKGLDITPNRIWKEWRETICCHALTFPSPADRDYITEEDFDNYIKLANQMKMDYIIEKCGVRNYGYYNVMFMKTEYAKKAMRMFFNGSGFDIDFDDRLNSILGLEKVVVTDSFVLHPLEEFKWTRQ